MEVSECGRRLFYVVMHGSENSLVSNNHDHGRVFPTTIAVISRTIKPRVLYEAHCNLFSRARPPHLLSSLLNLFSRLEGGARVLRRL